MSLRDMARRDLAPLSRYDVVLHGSAVTGHATPRSDVDVAIITHEQDEDRNRALWRRVLGLAPARYDIRVFELLPLPIQAGIVQNHVVVFGDPASISYAFYLTRREWKDQERRYRENRFESIDEKLEAMRRARLKR